MYRELGVGKERPQITRIPIRLRSSYYARPPSSPDQIIHITRRSAAPSSDPDHPITHDHHLLLNKWSSLPADHRHTLIIIAAIRLDLLTTTSPKGYPTMSITPSRSSPSPSWSPSFMDHHNSQARSPQSPAHHPLVTMILLSLSLSSLPSQNRVNYHPIKLFAWFFTRAKFFLAVCQFN